MIITPGEIIDTIVFENPEGFFDEGEIVDAHECETEDCCVLGVFFEWKFADVAYADEVFCGH